MDLVSWLDSPKKRLYNFLPKIWKSWIVLTMVKWKHEMCSALESYGLLWLVPCLLVEYLIALEGFILPRKSSYQMFCKLWVWWHQFGMEGGWWAFVFIFCFKLEWLKMFFTLHLKYWPLYIKIYLLLFLAVQCFVILLISKFWGIFFKWLEKLVQFTEEKNSKKSYSLCHECLNFSRKKKKKKFNFVR